MWPFKKNKFKKLKREEVVDAIIELDNREQALEEQIIQKSREEQALLEKGKVEKNRDIRLLYAKKIEALKKDRQTLVQRSLYLLYNLQLLKKLKDALDDKDFIKSDSDVYLHDLLSDQNNIAKFLNGEFKTKLKSEEIMTSADDVFNEVNASYTPDDKIYGVNESDDQLLAMFEESDDLPNSSSDMKEESQDVNI